MTTLREEITDYIEGIHADYEPDICNVDVILKIVEKRIDERYNEFENHRNEENIIKTEFGSGYLQGLRDVKEILK